MRGERFAGVSQQTLRDPPLLMAEAQYKYNQEKNSSGLAGSIQLAGWYHFGKFKV